MCVCVVFLELLTRKGGKILLVLFCGGKASFMCQYCYIQKYL